MIYLDNGATTKPDPAVVKSFVQVSEKYFANPSSIHEMGSLVNQLQDQARQQVAQLLQIHPEEVVFTSGGTEANNLAIKGIAFAHQERGKHIITTEIEHASVYHTCQALEKFGFRITYLPVNQQGVIDIADLEAALTDETILVSVMHVNNEIGSIQPIEAIANLMQNYPKAFFHVDAVQSLGKLAIDLTNPGIDLCSFSGHKIHGLKGSGFLYVKRGRTLFPLLHGGEQEAGRRAGTENVAANVAFAKALRLIKEKEARYAGRMQGLRDLAYERLEKIDRVQMNSPKEGAAHILHLSVIGMKPEVIIHALAEQGIIISTQSACSSKTLSESRILRACGHGPERARSGLRITLSYETEEEEIQQFVTALEKVLNRLKKVME